ncbi:MAG: Regulatory protein RecX [Candidatus Roizmanbacteria bacterium GW2011_GWC2_35_12]|uniref:Regulatory protein RecX n=2 Tax=Candidatus Roizmaniibacteriota TaxID=1752723 RepID=A0A0G0BUM8_9BACT|nr:MAG: Regulatory protein RecX [Candidatus Roizmanbacteria bacterium GW2011_GWC2_35_12]
MRLSLRTFDLMDFMDLNEDLIPLLNKAYFFLKFRPRTEKEVRDYLYKKIRTTHWSRDGAEEVIKKLKDQELIDDKKFVDWFVRQRTTLKPKGQRLLTRELLQKGIAPELIEDYFSENSVDEETLAFQILEKRWSRFKSLDSKKRFEKAAKTIDKFG